MRGKYCTREEAIYTHLIIVYVFYNPLLSIRHDGLIIMATNRPYDLDEAMHRRIMIAIEFRQPDHLLRKAIWESHIPQAMKLADDVNLVSISLQL